ncbi:MAG TPA: acetyl ornithine aminotransferase family protein [Candidatus Methanofastidiosa archaeon]|nr:acetyl ornithine aminotransferase family protein [Candidatus Methanofastidiosa archaeon]
MGLPRIVTELPGPKTRDWMMRDEMYVSPSYGRPYPLVAERASGLEVTDVDGNVFLDFSAGIAVCSTGHCHPEVVKEIKKQAARLIHMSGTDFYYREQILMAEEVSRITPGDMPKKSFFGNSGAEAIEAGFKLARYYSRRPRILSFNSSFHGRTYGALSLTGSNSKYKRGFAPMVPGVTHLLYPYCFHCPFNLEKGECDFRCLSYIEDEVFSKYVPPEEVSALVAEPILGEGGYVVPPEGYFQRLKRLLDEHGILFICDEVQSGMGRTGKMFAIEHWDIVPDIICMAKGIASGMPLGVCCASADIMDWHKGAHASTFGANPVSCRAALKTISLLENGLIDNAERMGNYLLDGLKDIWEDNEIMGDVRGKGLMIGVEFVKDAKNTPSPEISNAVLLDCYRKGIALLPCGKSTIRFCPPLVVSEDECRLVLEIFEDSVKANNKGR